MSDSVKAFLLSPLGGLLLFLAVDRAIMWEYRRRERRAFIKRLQDM